MHVCGLGYIINISSKNTPGQIYYGKMLQGCIREAFFNYAKKEIAKLFHMDPSSDVI